MLRLDLGNAMLGINNRNLEDFTVDLGNTRAIMASLAGQEARARSPWPSSPPLDRTGEYCPSIGGGPPQCCLGSCHTSSLSWHGERCHV